MKDRFRETVATAILAAAEEVLARDGVQAARMETIAATAGVAVGTVYNYFADRDALLDALIDRRKSQMLAQVDQALHAGQKLPWRAQFELFLRALLEDLETHRAFLAILMQGELLKPRAAVHGAKTAAGPMAELRERVERLMRRGVRDKVLRGDPADLYPSLLLGMIRGAFLGTTLVPTPAKLPDLAVPLARFFCEGAEAKRR